MASACWTRRIPHDVMLHTSLLPSAAPRGDLVLAWLEETLGEDADMAAIQPLNIVWIHSVNNEEKEDKIHSSTTGILLKDM